MYLNNSSTYIYKTDITNPFNHHQPYIFVLETFIIATEFLGNVFIFTVLQFYYISYRTRWCKVLDCIGSNYKLIFSLKFIPSIYNTTCV